MSEKEILDLEDKRFGAMIKGDFKALDAMVHEQLLYTHSSGNTDTKPSFSSRLPSSSRLGTGIFRSFSSASSCLMNGATVGSGINAAKT